MLTQAARSRVIVLHHASEGGTPPRSRVKFSRVYAVLSKKPVVALDVLIQKGLNVDVHRARRGVRAPDTGAILVIVGSISLHISQVGIQRFSVPAPMRRDGVLEGPGVLEVSRYPADARRSKRAGTRYWIEMVERSRMIFVATTEDETG